MCVCGSCYGFVYMCCHTKNIENLELAVQLGRWKQHLLAVPNMSWEHGNTGSSIRLNVCTCMNSNLALTDKNMRP